MPSWLTIRNADKTEGPVEMLIYEQIGKDWWDGSGVEAKAFAIELAKVDKDREITVCINSPGGNVWDGLAIYHQLQARKNKVTCRVDGIAASIASIIAMAGRETVMPENALMMIHNPYGMALGDAATMRKTADDLDAHKAVLVGIYADKTGMGRDEISALMDAETWFSGTEAKEKHLCDRTTDSVSLSANHDLSRFRRVPAGVIGGALPPPTDTKTKQKDTTMESNTTTAPPAEVTPTPVPTAPVSVIDVAEFNRLKAELAGERSKRITNELYALAADREIDAADWKERVVKDETLLTVLAKAPKRAGPSVTPRIEVSATEPSEPKNEIEAGEMFARLIDPKASARFYKAHRDKVLASVFNHSRLFTSPKAANSFTTLTHTVLATRAMEAFTYTLQPISAFSTNFSADAVARGDKVKVLFTAAASAAADWAGTYTIQGATATGTDITIDQRKFVSWGLSTEEIMTQPQLAMDTFAIQKGNALGLAFLQDVFSLITEANYGSGAITTTASGGDQLVETAANFDLDEVSWLYAACSLDNWPQMPRSLVLSIPYYASLFRESEVIGTEGLASSNPRMLAEAEIRRLMGFDIYETNAISATATDNVTGFAATPDGLMVAIRTMIPESGMSGSPSVRVLTDPGTGASIVQREWFDPDNDQSKRVLEVAYGKLKGNANGVKLISSS